jgi:hypothetical protein
VNVTVSPASAEELTHHLARERWGQPDERAGSVNDPRNQEEYGICFNEKWIYFLHDGSRRLVYWYRYDFRGALVAFPDGRLEKASI